MKIGPYEVHPAADVFPMMSKDERRKLAADIKANGLKDPIVIDKKTKKLVDGRNRLRACLDLGIRPHAVQVLFDDDDDVITFVLSKNVHRRHLTESQLALVAEGLATLGQGRRKAGARPSMTQQQAGRLLGVSERSVRAARELKESGRKDLVAAVAAGEVSLSRATRNAKRDELARQLRAKPMPPPKGPFDVVSLDPPWRYEKNASMTDADRRNEPDYPDMSLDEIIALNVPKLLERDAIVWLWTTNAHLLTQAPKVLEAWHLVPKTVLTWVKNKMGSGDWLRGQTEHCIMAVRGKPRVMLTNESTVLYGKAREHSRKPDEFYERVERLCPGTKLELFAREERRGWVTHGVELGRFAA